MPVRTTDDGPWPIEECDVAKKEGLKHFREKPAVWIDWLRGGNEHSICHQLSYGTVSSKNEKAGQKGQRTRSSTGLSGTP